MPTQLKKLQFSHWLAIGLIVGLVIACYINCLPNEMFWDDDDFILKNRFIKDWHFFPEFFTQNLVAGGYLVSNYWRPVLLTVFSIEWHLWKDWVYGWHTVSICFHALAGMTLYFLMERLLANRLWALLVALLFVAHPTHNEAVVYVNSLGDSLASLFVFLSLLCYTRFRQEGGRALLSRWYYFSILLYPLAIMSKETGFVLVALLLLVDFLMLQSNRAFWVRIKNIAMAAWPFVLMAITYVILRGTVLNFSNSFNFYNEDNAFTGHIRIRLFTFFKAITQYAAFLFCPYELKVERLLPWAQSFMEWDVLLGGTIVAVMLIAAFKCWKTKPWVSLGVGWFFMAIAPTSNVLVPINAVIYEHFLYVPMIGIVLIVTGFAIQLSQRRNILPTLIKIVALILIVFCVINVRRNMDWRTAIGFYEKLVAYRPDSYRVINNLGMEYADKGFTDKAEFWYNKAIIMDPQNPVAYHNIGGTFRDTGRVPQAIAAFKKAIELNPRFVFSYRSLAEIYYREGDMETARKYLRAALMITPDDINLRQGLQMLEGK